MTYPNHIPLKPADWRQIWWRKLPPLPLPKPVEFDWNDISKRREIIAKDKSYAIKWRAVNMSIGMSRREAHFWLMTILSSRQRPLPDLTNPADFTGNITLNEISQNLASAYHLWNAPQVMIPLRVLFPMCDLLPVLLNSQSIVFAEGWREFWLPYTPDDELEEMRDIIRPVLQNMLQTSPSNILGRAYYQIKPALMWGVYAGCGEELLQIAATFPDNADSQKNVQYNQSYLNQIQAVILGLPSSHQVAEHMKRINVPLTDAKQARMWLAHTEHTELAYLKDSVLKQKAATKCKTLINTLGLIKNAEVAAYMLEIMMLSKGADAARKWLDAHTDLAIEGIVPLAKGQGQLARAAVDFLRGLMRMGYADAIAEIADAALIKRLSDRTVTLDLPAFDKETTPEWLAEFEVELKNLKGVHPPRWIEAKELPPIVIGKHTLNDNQVATLMMALKASQPHAPHAMLATICAQADRHLLDMWLWELFDRWRINGYRKLDLWVLHAITLIGTDTTLPKLTTYIKDWYTQKGTKKKVRQLGQQGVNNLAQQASDTAFLQLVQIRDVVRSVHQRKNIDDALKRLASVRKISPDALHDKAVLDCGLDENGTTVFDYGRRQFYFVMGGDMSPMVRDEAGKIRKNLPKYSKLDDAALAEPAYKRWNFIKKQIRDTIKAQAIRLERAMVYERRWTYADFEEVFLKHPLLQHIAKPLVWGIYTAEENVVMATFRCAEDGLLVDAHDDPIQVPENAKIGIVHPLHIDEACRALWSEVLVDYELIPPFEQMNRQTFVLTPQQLDENPQDLAGIFDEPLQLVAGQKQMAQLGYEPIMNYYNKGSIRHFPNVDLTFVLEITNDYSQQTYRFYADRYVSRCVFVIGQAPQYRAYQRQNVEDKIVALKDIPPMVISEVLVDLTARIK